MALAAVAGCLCVTPVVTAQGAGGLLERAREYVARYERNLVALVADERYVQSASGSRIPEESTRTVESEFGWVAIPELRETVGVREVIRVDGRSVGAERRLRALLEHPRVNPSSEVAAILAESSRHNIGDVQRNVNFPTFALAYLRPRMNDGIRWRLDVGDAGVELRFEERGRTSIIRSAEGRRTPARGSFRVEPETGRILESSVVVPLVTGGSKREYRLDVHFAEDARLELWVPVRMRERATASNGAVEIAGEATYTNYRRYETGGRLVR